MGGSYLGIIVEAMVAILLVVTVIYCLIVNRKLESLRSDKSELREVILNLHRATTQAEQAIGNLKAAAGATDGTLSERIAQAQDLEARLNEGLGRGEALLSRFSALTAAKQKSEARPEPQRVAAPAAAPKFRHSEMGLGLLNAQRGSADGKSGMRDVA